MKCENQFQVDIIWKKKNVQNAEGLKKKRMQIEGETILDK